MGKANQKLELLYILLSTIKTQKKLKTQSEKNFNSSFKEYFLGSNSAKTQIIECKGRIAL